MRKPEFETFTQYKIVSEIMKEVSSIENKIENCNDAKQLDNYHRALAYLMQVLRVKEYSVLGWKESYNTQQIMKKFGFFNKEFPETLKEDILQCLDHLYKETRYYSDATQNVLVSEPYNLSMETCKKMIDFCEKNRLTFWIDGQSIHFPDNTFRINFMPIEQKERAIQTIKKQFRISQDNAKANQPIKDISDLKEGENYIVEDSKETQIKDIVQEGYKDGGSD